MNKIVVSLATALIAGSAFAAASKSEVRQIDTGKGLAVIALHGAKVQVGDSLIATSRDATQCSLPVRSVNKGTATVDVSSCSFQLRVGQNLETSMIRDNSSARGGSHGGAPSISTAEIRKVTPQSQTMGVTVFAYYNAVDKFKGDMSAKDNFGQTQTSGATFNSESAFGIGAEYAQYNYRFLGYYANGAYEFGRDIKSTDAFDQNFSGKSKPTLTMFLVDAGANFLINDNFYFKAGVNYNFPTLSGDSNIGDLSGKLGFEGGMGTRFLGNFNAEAVYRKLNFSANGKNGTSVDNLTASGFMVRGGYLF